MDSGGCGFHDSVGAAASAMASREQGREAGGVGVSRGFGARRGGVRGVEAVAR